MSSGSPICLFNCRTRINDFYLGSCLHPIWKKNKNISLYHLSTQISIHKNQAQVSTLTLL